MTIPLRERLQRAAAASLKTTRTIILGNVASLVFLVLAGVVVHGEMKARSSAQEGLIN